MFADMSEDVKRLEENIIKSIKDEIAQLSKSVPADVDRLFPFSRSVRNGLSILQEFYIEFFGLFIPGFVFVMSLVFMAFFAYTHMFVRNPGFVLGDVFGHVWVQLFAVCLSYVIGTVLYRKAPKCPDRISAYSQWVRTTLPFERNRLSVQYNAANDMPPHFRNTIDWLCYLFNPEGYILSLINKSNPRSIPDYPYPYLRQYLLHRGMWHLLPYVPWCANATFLSSKGEGEGLECFKEESIFERSKHLINILKQRIRVYGMPAVNSDIIRNESQIRLLSSIWYAMRYLMLCGLLIVGYPLAGLSIRCIKYTFHLLISSDTISFRFPSICGGWTFFVCMVVVVVGIWWVKTNIAEVIHYMRNREVVMILEAAYLIDRFCNLNGKDVFSDIKKRTDEFISKLCKDGCSCCPERLSKKCREKCVV